MGLKKHFQPLAQRSITCARFVQERGPFMRRFVEGQVEQRLFIHGYSPPIIGWFLPIKRETGRQSTTKLAEFPSDSSASRTADLSPQPGAGVGPVAVGRCW